MAAASPLDREGMPCAARSVLPCDGERRERAVNAVAAGALRPPIRAGLGVDNATSGANKPPAATRW
eukprot:358354-Chlamydomonas_euryale.AAC.5